MTSVTHNVWSDKRFNCAVVVFALVGVLAGAWLGYSWYRRGKESAAYKDLSESIEAFAKLRGAQASEEKWIDVSKGFSVGAQRHTSSSLYPYFLVYEADALLQAGKQLEALAFLKEALPLINKKNSLYYLYALKLALVRIDAGEEQGKEELATLARDAANPMRTMARYYQALLSESVGDTDETMRLFKEVGIDGDSYWATLAQQKLA